MNICYCVHYFAIVFIVIIYIIILIDAINQRDSSLVNACLLFSAVLMILGNLLSDVCYSVVDPRVKVDG